MIKRHNKKLEIIVKDLELMSQESSKFYKEQRKKK